MAEMIGLDRSSPDLGEILVGGAFGAEGASLPFLPLESNHFHRQRLKPFELGS
jgi:hypothetical protein